MVYTGAPVLLLFCLGRVLAAPDLAASGTGDAPSVEVTLTKTEFRNLRECEENVNPVLSYSGTISLPTTDQNLCISGMDDFKPFAMSTNYYWGDVLVAACDMETGNAIVTNTPSSSTSSSCVAKNEGMSSWVGRSKELITPGGGACMTLQRKGGSDSYRYLPYSRFDYVDASGDNYAGVCGRTGPTAGESITTLNDITSQINELEVTMIDLLEARRRRKAAENMTESGCSRAMGSTLVITLFAAIFGGLL